MEKVILTLIEYKDHPQGYGLFQPPKDDEVWEFIFNNMPANKKYLKHFVRTEWIPTGGYHTGYGENKDRCGIKVPLGILTYYIDVYYEDR